MKKGKCVDIFACLCYIKDMKCPNCLNSNEKMIQRFGHTKAGKQRFRCVQDKCYKTFTLESLKTKVFPYCPKCHFRDIWLAGQINGRQRYKCKRGSCGKSFFTGKVKRQKNKISAKQIESVLNAMFGERLSLRQTAKAINMPFSAVRRLFFAACNAEIKKAINPKNLSETARRKYAEIFKMNIAEVKEYLLQRGFKFAIKQLKKNKDKDSLAKLKRLSDYYLSY